MLLGFLLHGLGLSVWNIVPYNQLSLAVPASDYPKYYGIYECCFSMFSPAGARFLMMVCTVSVESRWGWRLPWLICSCATAANLVLVALWREATPPPDRRRGDPPARGDRVPPDAPAAGGSGRCGAGGAEGWRAARSAASASG